ncbi:MAG: DUF2783 domain-containing protein [Sphingomonadales bacterium]|nr:DUF2783 domain-containing protein [Sphingomonadales bacterium]
MMSLGLSDSDLEQAFDRLAQALDAVGEDKERSFLAALALTLAGRMAGLTEVDAAIAMALRAAER